MAEVVPRQRADAGGSVHRVPAPATVHVRVLRGIDRHHVVEAAVKAVGLALRQALAAGDAVFSTKGAVTLEREG